MVLGLWRLSALLGKTARSIPGWDRWRTGRRFGNQETGGPHEASIALSSSVFGYAIGQFAPNWLDDKTVPQAMDILPIALTIETSLSTRPT